MSVLQIKDRITRSQAEFDSFSLSHNSLLLTTASDDFIEEFSLELTLGEGWNENYTNISRDLRKINESITVQGHGSIVVEVKEHIHVPHNRYGIVLPTGSLFLSRGILVASAKVEPAFRGKLKLRMFNTTGRKIILKKGEKIGSIIFFSTESTKLHPPIERMSEISDTATNWWDATKKWVAENKVQTISWTVQVLTSSLLTFILSYIFYFKPMLEMQKPENKTQTTVTQSQPGK
jgi:deoxycytidine triphosphate deaminase